MISIDNFVEFAARAAGRRVPVRPLVFAAALLAATLAPPALASQSDLMFRAPALLVNEGPLPYGYRPGVGDAIHGVATDLDGDGRADIALLASVGYQGYGGTPVEVLYARTYPHVTTVFEPQPVVVKLPADTVDIALAIKLGDANEDGRKDIILSYASGDSILVLLNPGSARYQPGTPAPGTYVKSYAGGASSGLAVGDVNGDGHIDVVVNTAGPSVRALLGDGTGAFTLGPVSGTGVAGTLLADVDGDGHLDLVGPDSLNNVVTFYHGNGDGTFNAGVSLSTALGPNSVAVGDVNGDGIADIVAGCAGSNFASLLRGLGSGVFASSTDYALGQFGVRDVALADLTGDGYPEIIAGCAAMNDAATETNVDFFVNTLVVLRNNTFGGFSAPQGYEAGGTLGDLMVADFDGEGSLDVAASDFNGMHHQYPFSSPYEDDLHTVSVLLNDGSGRLGDGDLVQLDPAELSWAVPGDFDRDGKLDFVTSRAQFNQNFLFHKGNGDGTFADAVEAHPFAFPATYCAAGDINRDGKLDLVVWDNQVAESILGNGDGTFTDGPTISGVVSGSIPVFGAGLVDMNGDGKLDLVVMSGYEVQILLGTGTGAFGSPASYTLPGDPGNGDRGRGFVVDDWNRDGKPDVAVPLVYAPTFGEDLGGVKLFWGNGDGTLTPGALLETGSTFLAITSGDWNRDGKPDLAARRSTSLDTSGPVLTGPVVFLGDGAGGFSAGAPLTGLECQGFWMGSWDVNRDGYPDLLASALNVDAVADTGDGARALTVYLGDGPGGLSRDSDYLFGTTNAPPAVGDFDRDGQPDVMGYERPNGPGTFAYMTLLRGNQPPFPGPPTNLVTSTTPGWQGYSISVGDINRDGIADAVVTGAGIAGDILSVLTGHGDGTFTTASLFAMPDEPNRTAVGDLNHDGIPDVAVATGVSDAVLVLLGNSLGVLSPPTTIVSGLGYEYTDIALADLNRDGNLDIVAASAGASLILVLLGNGDGTFGAPAITVTGTHGPTGIAVGDTNRDGIPDIVMALGSGTSPNSIGVLLGNGDGTFQTIRPYTAGASPYAVALGDFNRDGVPDVAVTLEGGAGARYVAILLGLVGGGFGAATTYPLSALPLNIATADIDGDGILDIVVPGYYPGTQISYLRGLGDGTFAAKVDITVGSNPTNLAIGDFNRDGRPDIATALQGGPTVAVLLSQPSALTGVADPGAPPVPVAVLSQNAPNPFNPDTRIGFSLSHAGPVTLRVYDVRGREVVTLVNATLQAGQHQVVWSGVSATGVPVASGVYFYRLEAPRFKQTRRMVLLK